MVGVAVMLKIGQQESNEDDIKELQKYSKLYLWDTPYARA